MGRRGSYALMLVVLTSYASEWVQVQCPPVIPFTFCIFAEGCGAGGWFVTFNSEGNLLGTISSTGPIIEVKIWDFQNVTLLGKVPLPNLSMTCYSLDFSPDGRRVAIGCFQRYAATSAVRIWDVNAGQKVHDFVMPILAAPFVKFSPDGLWLAAALHKQVRVWDVVSGEQIYVLPCPANTLAFSPDGKLLACALMGADTRDFRIQLWYTDIWEEALTLPGHIEAVSQLAFSPDGKFLASSSLDGTIKIWDVGSGTEIRTLVGHTGGVLSISFSPDGQFLASSAMDHTIRLWRTDSGQEVLTIDVWNLFKLGEGFKTERELAVAKEVTRVHVVTFSPDGTFLVSSTEIMRPGECDEAIHIWRFPRF